MDADNCAICNNKLSSDEETFIVTQKGIDSINRASVKREENIIIQLGQRLHKKCRQRWINPKYIEMDRKKRSTHDAMPSREIRSLCGFNFKEHCLFCGSVAKFDSKNKSVDVSHVETIEFKDRVLKVGEKVRRNDDWASTVKGRICYVADLVSQEARYHRTCFANFDSNKNIPKAFFSVDSSKKQNLGRPEDSKRKQAFLEVTNYLQQNDEEQLTIVDLVKKMEEILEDTGLEPYSLSYMKSRLLEHFKDKIILTEINGKPNVVTFLSTAKSILNEFYAQSRSRDNSETEAIRIIETAAKLIKYDIKSIQTSSGYYPSKNDLEQDAILEYVPKSLLIFLRNMFAGKDNDLKLASIGQAIMQAVRPRVLLAPLQFGLAVEMHNQFGSRFLIDTLNKHGFSSSYSEVQKFERSAALVHGTEILFPVETEFVQFVADNVDHNVRSIDGFNTFHGMGIIASVTPGKVKAKPIPRIQVFSEEIIKVGRIKIKFLDSRHTNKPPVTFKKLLAKKVVDSTANVDILWEVSLILHPSRPAWSGLMQSVYKGTYPGKSATVFLPMIDMDPGNPTCVYSTLCYISDLARKNNITPILTFDQPLWYKAMMIVESQPSSSPLKSFVLRLGGLHTQMSFLGSIGHLMKGSGLQELFELVYAENTVNHMLSGKAIARAIRAHFLVAAALNAILLAKAYDLPVSHVTEHDQPNTDAEESFHQNKDLKEAQGLLIGLLGRTERLDNVLSSESVTRITQKINHVKDAMVEQRTAKLWIQYLDMVKSLQLFIKAERTGNWELHLDAVRKMLPIFAAAGHILYAKSAYLYLQQMEGLPKTHPEVYQKFSEGFHVIRRSDRYWAGLSTDLVIEQVLMRSLKTSGGLTHGRGMDEIQRLVWTLSLPACAEIKFTMQELAGIHYGTSDQHQEATSARKERDVRDTWKVLAFLQTYDPFTEDPSIHSISSGVTGDKKVNVDRVNSIGEAIIASMAGENVQEYTFKKKDQAITLGSKVSLSKDETVETDPQLLFQRLCVLSNNEPSTQEQQEHFQYELCGYPPALFDYFGLLRQAKKSALADAIWELTSHVQSGPQSSDPQYLLDGGALLQRLPWQKGRTFNEICDQYCRYVTNRYGKACVVFDGYESGPSIKDSTHRRRAGGFVGVNVSLTPFMVFKLKKDVFLANRQNKQLFINLLGKSLKEAGCKVIHASGDADVLIVKTTLELAQTGETILIADDTDLLVLLCYHTNSDDIYNIFFTPQPKASEKRVKVWNIKEVRKSLGDAVCSNILFIHALLGCDSTSSVHGIGKAASLRKVMNNRNFLELAEVFGKDSSAEEVIEAGEKALVCLYNGNDGENINHLRLRRFKEKVAKSSKYVEAKSLPPTRAATKFHSLRVYFQIQEWKGRNQLKPDEWGWTLSDGKLQPVKTDLQPGPVNLLAIIRCNCTSECTTGRCSCRKHGIHCSNLCGYCKGLHCTNSSQPDLEDDDDEVTFD